MYVAGMGTTVDHIKAYGHLQVAKALDIGRYRELDKQEKLLDALKNKLSTTQQNSAKKYADEILNN